MDGIQDWVSFFSINGDSYMATANYRSSTATNGDYYTLNSHVYKYNPSSLEFEIIQDIETHGARDIESFQIDNRTFIAFANERNVDTLSVNSTIYEYNSANDNFTLFQSILTEGARDWEYFYMGTDHFLAVANYGDDICIGTSATDCNKNSKIYKYDSGIGKFVDNQTISTRKCADFEYFEMDGNSYLAYTEYDAYYQYLCNAYYTPLPNGYNCQPTGLGNYLCYNICPGAATQTNSKVMKYNTGSSEFEIFQNDLQTFGAIDFEFFQIDGSSYLVVANNNKFIPNVQAVTYEIDSQIFKSDKNNDGKFAAEEDIETKGATDWEVFVMNGKTYLSVSNSRDDSGDLSQDSVVYQYNGTTVVTVQEIATEHATDSEYFEMDGRSYLAIANYMNDTDGSYTEYTTKSTIYLGDETYSCGTFDECASDPCQNGGTCNDGINGYTCTCDSGYEGTHCGTEIDECESNPCENGATCNDEMNYYTCFCPIGYEGTNCEINTDNCFSNPCQNGGTCVDDTDKYNCTCVAGYEGEDCDTDIDECGSSPCQNGGTCVNLLNEFSCFCGSYSNPFDFFQEKEMEGTVDWTYFTINNNSYLASANYFKGTGDYTLDSYIYKYDPFNSTFEEFQVIETQGARDIESFQIGNRTFLAIANQVKKVDGPRNIVYETFSKIYEFNSTSEKFILFQTLLTNGASDWEYFSMGTEHFLAVSNFREDYSLTTNSVIYKYNSNQFESNQSVSTTGCKDVEYFEIAGESYLAYAQYHSVSSSHINSTILKYNTTNYKFEFFQNIFTTGAMDFEFFQTNNKSFLVVANNRYEDNNGVSNYTVNSEIFIYNASAIPSFTLYETILTSGAYDWEIFLIIKKLTWQFRIQSLKQLQFINMMERPLQLHKKLQDRVKQEIRHILKYMVDHF